MISRGPPKEPSPTDAENTRVQKQISADQDNPEWTEEELKSARPLKDVLPDLNAALMAEFGSGGTRASKSDAVSDPPTKEFTADFRGYKEILEVELRTRRVKTERLRKARVKRAAEAARELGSPSKPGPKGKL